MIRKLTAAAASLALIASPGAAAELWEVEGSVGARRSSAVAGAYLAVPLGRATAERPRAGLRLSMRHDYREALAPSARLIEADALDLRLIGERQPALFVAGQRFDGERRASLKGAGTVVLVLVSVAAVAGAIALSNAIDDSGGE